MARIRTIKPEFPQSESIGKLSRDARLLYIQLWTIVDDAGRARAASRMLASLLYPYDDDARDLIEGWLLELERGDHIRRYQVDGAQYLEIVKWLEHQKIDKPSKSRLPEFVDASRAFASIREASPTDLVPRTLDLVPRTDARSDLEKRVGDFRQAIVQAYAEANSPSLPDTSRAELWISQGYQEDICLAVVAEIVRKKPTVGLNYFDKPIAEAHTKKAPPRKAVGAEPPIDWDAVFVSYRKFGRWSRHAGNDPTSPNCRAPPEFLQKYGFAPMEEAS